MQTPPMKLQEIIWEITGRCENGCSFCGSKEGWTEEINYKRIIEIAESIVADKETIPDAIDISGGDPLLVKEVCHKDMIKILKGAGIECKIVINPKSVYGFPNDSMDSVLTVIKELKIISSKLRILKLYDHVGISINNTDEVKKYGDLPGQIKSTVITNFNVSNIFHFDAIAEMVRKHDVPWMVQYTVYKEKSDLAIYEDQNEPALKELCKKIQEGINDGLKIVLSDNANPGECTAGTRSIGILSDGTVVPCLSMRSWEDDIKSTGQGNVLDNSLKHIWQTKFHDYRFESFKCCKDHCNNKCIFFAEPLEQDSSGDENIFVETIQNNPPIVVLYGVLNDPPNYPNFPSGVISIYAVANPPIATYYMVTTGQDVSIEPGGWIADKPPILTKYGVTNGEMFLKPRNKVSGVRGRSDIKFVYGTFSGGFSSGGSSGLSDIQKKIRDNINKMHEEDKDD